MRFLYQAEVSSTNDVVRGLAEDGERGPLWLRADSQSAGRGRRGRVWTSAKGNLFISGLFALTGDPLAGAQLGFAAALAIADTIKTYAPDANVTLKWPNDVLVDGAKISGILLETGGAQDRWLIVGIGLNLTHHPLTHGSGDTPYPATHLLAHIDEADLLGPEPVYTGVEAVMAVLSARFMHWRDLHSTHGFAPLRAKWLAQAQGMGERAQIRTGERTITARLVTLGENGELQIAHDNGTIEAVYAGDVFPQET